MLSFIKEAIGGGVSDVRFTNTLSGHPVSIATEGALSATMEKTLERMPGTENAGVKAEKVLQINMEHPVAEKLKSLYGEDKEKLAKYSKVLYAAARLISGLGVEDPSGLGELITGLMLD